MLQIVLAKTKNVQLFNLACKRNMSLLLSKCLINGSWVDSSDNSTFDVVNPADGKVIGKIPDMTVDDAQKAVEAAKIAFYSKDWSQMTVKTRSSILKSWFNLIEKNRDEIASIMTSESGKPINESLGELAYGNSYIEWFAEEARRIYGEIIPSPLPNRELITIKQPIGVAVLITPWNFPLAMLTRKAGAALAAGCTIIMKPSEDTPLTALAIAKLAETAGFPKGVINVVTTKKGQKVGDLFCKSEDVASVSFTGSTEVGKILYKNCSDTMKRLSLELGGNAPFIVFDSADIERAVESAMIAKFRNCGQTCVAANRFYIQKNVYEKFVNKLKEKVKNIKVGNGHSKDIQCGPLINTAQFNKICSFVEDAKNCGANIVLGGKAMPELGCWFYEPTIITNLNADMKIYSEEIFGPVIAIATFEDEDEVINKANCTRRGLAGYFFSNDLSQVFRVARRLEVGMVGVNEGLISTSEIPFGGIKESGLGREGGHHGINEFVDVKYICLGNLKY